MNVERCEGVYDPDDDSYLMLNIDDVKGNVLDLGSGTGIVGIHYSKKGCNVTSSDISREAVRCTRINSMGEGLKINVVRADLLTSIKGHFDFCLFNPPYLPDEEPNDPSWSGGIQGTDLIYRFISSCWDNCDIVYLIESSLAPIERDVFRELKMDIVRNINYEFEELHLVRLVKDAQYR